MNFSIDSKTISKQIENSKLKQKVIVTAGVLLVVVIAWFIIDYTTRREPTIDESFTSLAEPFRFNLNQEVFDSLRAKEQYTDDQLSEFPIYLVDENAISRGNSLVVFEMSEEINSSGTNFVPDEGEEGEFGEEPEAPINELPENIQSDTGGEDFFQEI